MPVIKKKKYLDKNVLEMARERIEYLYSVYDDLVVSFSGGKDSTATLLVTLEVARDLGKLPVRAVFYDEEAIHPPTIEYVRRVSQREDVELEWYCLEVQHRNACSNKEPFWYCWDHRIPEKWVRPLPPEAITEHPRFEFGQTMQEFGELHFRNSGLCVLQGIRTEESIRRYRAVARKKNDNYITSTNGTVFAYPIYDWSSKDVWKLITVTGEDYNRTYDVFNKTDQFEHFLQQRVCPPFGEEPIRGLYVYAECFPEMWQKMIDRVPGAATAARYGNTELYSKGYRPEHTSWRKHIENVLESYSPQYRNQVKKALNGAIKVHKAKTSDPIPEDEAHPLSGCSWKFLSKMVTRGDFKGRIVQGMQQAGEQTRNKMGITLKQAQERYSK